jgi:hypothetical protein
MDMEQILNNQTQTIVLIMCGREKLGIKEKAENMYTSLRFKYYLEYAKKITAAENIFVLSAKHALLPLSEEIEPYDKCLDNMTVFERKEWTERVLNGLTKVSNIDSDIFILLANYEYSKDLLPYLKHYEVPLKEYKEIGLWQK